MSSRNTPENVYAQLTSVGLAHNKRHNVIMWFPTLKCITSCLLSNILTNTWQLYVMYRPWDFFAISVKSTRTYDGGFSICFEWDIQERKLEDELSFVYQARPHQKSEIHCYYSWVTDQSDSSMAVVATPWLLYVILLLVLIDLVCVYSWM